MSKLAYPAVDPNAVLQQERPEALSLKDVFDYLEATDFQSLRIEVSSRQLRELGPLLSWREDASWKYVKGGLEWRGISFRLKEES